MNYFEVYKTVWDFHKKYSKVEDNDQYWENVVNESGEISKRYDNAKFVIDLLLAVITELERICKTQRRENSG